METTLIEENEDTLTIKEQEEKREGETKEMCSQS